MIVVLHWPRRGPSAPNDGQVGAGGADHHETPVMLRAPHKPAACAATGCAGTQALAGCGGP
jgi:hypothetical protein